MTQDFKGYLKSLGLADSSIKKYLQTVTQFTDKYDINNPDDLAQFLSSARRYHARFAVLHFLHFLGMDNIASKFKDNYRRRFRPLPRKTTRKHLTKLQVRSLIAMLDPPYNLTASVQYVTALRLGSLLRICKKDVYLDDNQDVYVAIIEKGNERFEQYIPEPIGKQLLGYIKYKQDSERVFAFPQQEYNNRLAKASMTLFGFTISSHWLRFSRGLNLLDEGMSMLDVSQNVWRHKSVDTSLHYFKSRGVDNTRLLKEYGGI